MIQSLRRNFLQQIIIQLLNSGFARSSNHRMLFPLSLFIGVNDVQRMILILLNIIEMHNVLKREILLDERTCLGIHIEVVNDDRAFVGQVTEVKFRHGEFV